MEKELACETVRLNSNNSGLGSFLAIKEKKTKTSLDLLLRVSPSIHEQAMPAGNSALQFTRCPIVVKRDTQVQRVDGWSHPHPRAQFSRGNAGGSAQ